MSKRNSAKYKLDRRMGENIFGRPKSPVNKREYGPGQHGQRRKGKMSDFGIQLRAKQKLKGYYGDVTEKQFKRTYHRGRPDEGRHRPEPDRPARAPPRHDRLSRQVRADHLVAARQLVSHGHIRVNGVKCNIASRRVNVGDEITLGAKAQEMALVMEAQGLAERDIPDYVAPDGTAKVDLHPRADARRSALSGEDGAEPGRRVLLALIRSFADRRKGRLLAGAALFRLLDLERSSRRKASVLAKHVGARRAVVELVVEPGIDDQLALLAGGLQPSSISCDWRDRRH